MTLTLVQGHGPDGEHPGEDDDFQQERCVLDGDPAGFNVSASVTVFPGRYIFVDQVTYRVLGNPPQTAVGPSGAYGTGNGNLMGVPPQPGKGKVVAVIDGQGIVVLCYFIDVYNPPGWQVYPLHACSW